MAQPARFDDYVRPASEDPLGDPGLQDFAQSYGQPDYGPEQAEQHFDQLQYHPEFQQAQQDFIFQAPPDQFQTGAEQAVQQLAPDQQQEIAGGLMSALGQNGFDLGQIASALGMGSTSPQEMNGFDLSRLLGWAQQNAPGAVHQAVGGKPWFIKAMGNPIVSQILGNLAGRLFGR